MKILEMGTTLFLTNGRKGTHDEFDRGHPVVW